MASKKPGKSLAALPPLKLLQEMAALLADSNGSLTSLIDDIADAVRDGNDEGTCELLAILASDLELMRLDVEGGDRRAAEAERKLRDHIAAMAATGTVSAGTLMLILKAFAMAKVDPGEELLARFEELLTAQAATPPEPDIGDLGAQLASMVADIGPDPFVIHAEFDTAMAAFPAPLAVGFATACFASDVAELREASVGFLLGKTAEVRMAVAQGLRELAGTGGVSPVMLRRMIALSAMLAAVKIDRVVASAVDGSGAMTVLVVVKEGRKYAVAGLLVKHGVGVRDAWVMHGAPAAKVNELIEVVRDQVGAAPCGPGVVGAMLSVGLEMNARSGSPPPFAVLDFAETAGIAALEPSALSPTELIAALIEEVRTATPGQLTPAAVAKTLAASGSWQQHHPELETWFEPDMAGFLGGGAKSGAAGKKQIEALLQGPLLKRRHRWAELAVWTALVLKHRTGKAAEKSAIPWQDFAVLARELNGERDLSEIGLMVTLARETVTQASMIRLGRWQHRLGQAGALPRQCAV
jgi:hypothetical protein